MQEYWTRVDYLVVSLIFAVVLGARLILVFQYPFLVGDESFHWQRQAQTILDTGRPLSEDALFVGGRTFESFTLFAYVISIPAALGSFVWGSKVLINVFASLIVFCAFLICKKTTNSRYVAYLTSFFAGCIPVFWEQTVHTLSIYAFALPLFVWCINSFLDITFAKRFRVWWYALAIMTYSLFHPSVLLFLMGLVIYLVMLKVENIEISKSEWELILFSMLTAGIMQVVMYRDVLLSHGLMVVWQNIPSQIVTRYFSETTLLQAFYRIGEIPVFFGILIIAKYLFREKNKTVYLFISFALSIGSALFFRLIEPDTGMMFLGSVLVLLFSYYYSLYLQYVPSTRFERFLPVLKTVFFLTFLLTSVVPAVDLVSARVSSSHMERHLPALVWLKQNTPSSSVVVAPIEQAAMIAAVANRSVVADTNFLLVDDSQYRMDQTDRLFTSPYESFAVEIMEEFGAQYIYVDKFELLKSYNQTDLPFLDRFALSDCFARVYNKGVEIFKKTCQVRLVS